MDELMKEKDALSAERDRQVEEISKLRSDISSCLHQMRAKDGERTSTAQEISSMKELVSNSRSEQERDGGRHLTTTDYH